MITPICAATAGFIQRTTLEVAVDGLLLAGSPPPPPVTTPATAYYYPKNDGGQSGKDIEEKLEREDQELLAFIKMFTQCLN